MLVNFNRSGSGEGGGGGRRPDGGGLMEEAGVTHVNTHRLLCRPFSLARGCLFRFSVAAPAVLSTGAAAVVGKK